MTWDWAANGEVVEIFLYSFVMTALLVNYMRRRPHDNVGVSMLLGWLAAFFITARLSEIVVALRKIALLLEAMQPPQ